MPCFNGGAYLREAVDSVLCQSYPNVELIVIDDGSTDNSLDILAEYNSRITLIRQQNQGPYPARNKGLEHCQGEYIAFLDADDYWSPQFLREMAMDLDRSDTDVVYCGWQNVGATHISAEPYIPPDYNEDHLVSRFIKSCPWPIHAAVVKRSVLDKLGGFREDYFSSMDFDLWLRMLTVTRKIRLHPEVLAYYRWHDNGQISSVKWKQVINAWKVRKDFVRSNPELVADIDEIKLSEMIDGAVKLAAYRAYWDRSLVSARRLFLKTIAIGNWSARDLRYCLFSFLPTRVLACLDQSIATKRVQ